MKQPPSFSILLLACFSLYLFNTDSVNTVYAAQDTSIEARQQEPRKIYGKVTNVIATNSFTYVELVSDKGKLWAAGPVTPIKKGDMISFSTMMPMQNFYSKSLGRHFSLLFITNRYVTDKATSSPMKSSTPPLTGSPNEISKGGYLRDVILDGLNGKSKTFSDFKGKPLIINIWASWCGPCRAEMASLERLALRYNRKDFIIIGISTDDYRSKAVALIKQTGITFDNFLDHKLLIENMLGAKTIPLTILVDVDGRILKKVRGAREWDSPEVIDAIGDVFHIKL